MTMNQRVSMWRIALAGVVLLAASAVVAQTCNPNAQKWVSSWSVTDTVTDAATGLVWQLAHSVRGWNGGTRIGTQTHLRGRRL